MTVQFGVSGLSRGDGASVSVVTGSGVCVCAHAFCD